MPSHLKRLREKMRAQSVEAILVSSEDNQRYLTGFAFTDGYVLVTASHAWLLTDFRYIEAAGATVDKSEFELLCPEGSMTVSAAELFSDAGVKTVTVEEDTLSLSAFDKLKDTLSAVKIAATGGASVLFTDLRVRKDEEELAVMRRAQSITDAAFAHILDFITPERTEVEVALELEFFMRAHGAEGVSFETIAVSGVASSMPHGVPRPVKLEKGFLTMDFGAKVDGYCSDMTRTVVIGRADSEMKRLYATVLRAQTEALAAAAEGVGCKYLDTVARDIIHGAGYVGKFGHSLGHGVGMFIHETPRLSQGAKPDSVLERGNVVTFEPGIYLAGQYGCRIEDMAAILPDGTFSDFTKSPKELIEL